jgi:tetratricopeptide (TPR) repeat protein
MRKNKKIFITFLMLAGIIWLIMYAWKKEQAKNADYSYTDNQLNDLGQFPKAWYDYGRKAWYENRVKDAAEDFTRAVSGHVLYVDAWINLAMAEAALGNTDKAVKILRFTNELTEDVIEWKWQHIMLAGELGINDMFLQDLNYVIPYPHLQSDALQLLDMSYKRQAAKVLRVMDPDNRLYYLRWLMRWRRTEDTWTVWTALDESDRHTNQFYEEYVNFLVQQKAIPRAASIWRKYTNITGITNPGFERELCSKGFGWRSIQGKKTSWTIERSSEEKKSGRYSLHISFDGTENINFYHVRQIVPVEPQQKYLFSCWWKSSRLTTDQRPFIDIYGYDHKSRHWHSEMLPEESDWHQVSIHFFSPADCHAVTICIRRRPSHRFDCKIDGECWLDDVELHMLSDSLNQGKDKERVP